MEIEKYRRFSAKEQKWIKQFSDIMKKAPSSLFLFTGAGSVVYALDEKGERYMTDHGTVDQHATHSIVVTKLQIDGGDY